MKKAVIFFVLSMFVIAPAALAAPVSPRTMTFPPLNFQIPKTERVVLENGMVVHLLEDHELPTISVTAYIGTGSAYEPEGKTGLAGLTGALMRTGGTTGTSAEQMDEELEFMASSVEASIGMDVGNASMISLTRNFDRTLQLYAQMLMSPVFRADRVELARNKAIESLRRENDDPKEVADRELRKAIYRGSPLGSHSTIASVSGITREDIVAFHSKYYHPNNVILAIAGDFKRNELLDKLNKVFAGWKREPVAFPAVPTPGEAGMTTVYLVKKDVSQTVIRMGHLGIDKTNPDMYALRVMNFILGGGGFESKLMSQIRTGHGLAYNVESDFSPGRRFPGTFTAETETKVESTAESIALMRNIIEGMTKEPVTAQELAQAKQSIITSFIFGFTSSASVANQRAMLEYYGYLPGYLEHYRENVAKVTREDVLRVAKKYLRPHALEIVVVGDEAKFDKPLSVFGNEREINLKQER